MKYTRYLLLLLLPACKAPDVIRSGSFATLKTDSNKLSIAGNYENLSRDQKTTLWKAFSPKGLQDENANIRVSATSKKRITLTLFKGDSILASKSFRYKEKGNLILIRRPYKTEWPIGPLIWVLFNSKFWIGRNKRNQLFVCDESSRTAFLVIMPLTGAAYTPTYLFDPLEEN